MLSSWRVGVRHYSSTRVSTKFPKVKVYDPNSERRKLDRKVSLKYKESDSYKNTHQVTQHGPHKQFEPFPFKVDDDNKIYAMNKVVAPLHDVPYQEQLASKETFCRNALRLFGRELYNNSTPIRLDVKRLPCHLNSIVPSPILTNYRNKEEISIWRGLDGKTITAGYLIFPISRHGDSVCVEPSDCLTIKEESIKAIEVFQNFLREKAQLPVSYDLGTDGGWRRAIVRTTLSGEVMFIGIINPRGLRVREVVNERDNFRDFMVEQCKARGLKLSSLYYQPCPHNNCPHSSIPYELLYGNRTITETIDQRNYVISPESFFHQNTKGAETLLSTVKTMIDECFTFKETGSQPLIIDAHCGIGVLALNLAGMAKHVIGVDNSSQSVDDAKTNAKLNSVNNVEFICSNLEIVLERILEKYSKYRNDTLVICDVPNSGLHPNAIDALRQCKEVRRILFITSKINSPKIMDNLVVLCSRGSSRSIPPFAPLAATPVDLYPHVEAFPTIIALERLPETNRM